MELDEILPERPIFSLSATGKQYELRLVNLEDQVWIRNHLGDSKEVSKIFEEVDWTKISKFAYRLLKDKKDFLAKKEKVINDDGEEVDQYFTGPELFLKSITGLEEGLKMLTAVTKSIALSNPVVEKHLEQELKKNTKSLTGQKYSTSSQVNTDGTSIKSES